LKDKFILDQELNFSFAVKKLKSLSETEMRDYLLLLQKKLTNIIADGIDDKYLPYKMLYGTIIRQLPSDLDLSEENTQLKLSLLELMEEFDSSIER